MSRRFELLLLAFVWVVFLAFINAPGRSEGKFFPIMTNFSYEVSETVDVEASNVFLSFDKIRSDCAFRGVEFYLNEMQDGEVAQTVKIHAKFFGKEQGRFAGSHTGSALGRYALHRNSYKTSLLCSIIAATQVSRRSQGTGFQTEKSRESENNGSGSKMVRSHCC